MTKNRTITLFAGATVAALLVAILVIASRQKEPAGNEAPLASPMAKPAAAAVIPEPPVVAVEAPSTAQPEKEAGVSEVVELPKSDGDAPEPINYYNGMDPESQPRSFHRTSFRNLDKFPAGFTLTGDYLRLSAQGWTLAPPTEGEEDLPRSGMVESPVFELDFPSNALSSLWKEDVPAGTDVLVELAASPDGVNWTDWYPTTGEHVDDEPVQFNEDTGEPNPNYGYTFGDVAFFGLGKYKYYKYNLMLYSETGDSPVLSDLAIYQQDSTMGDGYEVEYVADMDSRKEKEQ